MDFLFQIYDNFEGVGNQYAKLLHKFVKLDYVTDSKYSYLVSESADIVLGKTLLCDN